MNVDVIRAAVKLRPEQMDMDSYGYEEACGTVGCIAGNCLIQHGLKDLALSVNTDPRGKAAELMGLDYLQSGRLFYVDRWPLKFIRPAEDGEGFFIADDEGALYPGTPEYLARVKERVEHFIATEGRE